MSQNIIDYANHISSIGCAQLINKPTRIGKTSSTIIDHIYANGTFDNQVSPFILCADISDHLPVCAEVKHKPTKKIIKRPFLRQFSEERMEMFLIDLCRKINTLEMLNNCDVNTLLTILSDLTNQFFPKKRLSRKQYKVAKNPWITPKILTAIKNKDKLYANYLKERTPVSFTNYKKCRNQLTHAKIKAKQSFFENLFRETKNPSDTWKHINKFLRKQKSSSAMPQAIITNGKTITSPHQICNEMNIHFVKIGEKLSSNIKCSNSGNFTQFLGKRQVSSIYLRPTDAFEVIETISGLNKRKSSGYIDIPVLLIKEAKFLIGRQLANIFNECLRSGSYPDILKIAKVVPLHKGGSKLDLNNYRPISILSPINKIFETTFCISG